MLWIYHHVTGEPGHWEGRHYSLDEIPTSGYTAYDVWVPHCERHPAVPRPCRCEGSSLGIDEGAEA